MRHHFLRPKILGALLMVLLVMTALSAVLASYQHAGATSTSQKTVDPRLVMAFPHKTIQHITVSPKKISSNGSHFLHFLYVENGTCSDSIDVYKIGTTLTHVGNYPNDGCASSSAYYGTQRIAIAKANSVHSNCLVFADQAGFVDSFPINGDGSLGAEVSHLATATGASPSDVHIYQSGNIAYVSNPLSDLESYGISAGCTLTFLSSAPTTQFYISFALVNTQLVAPDSNTGNIDTWMLTPTGVMKFRVSVVSQIGTCPDSIAMQPVHTLSGPLVNVFTGQCTLSAPLAQGGQYTRFTKNTGAISFLSGSPSGDPSGGNGAASTFDNTHNLLIQGEQITSTLGVYSVSAGTPGVPGSMAFMEETPLAVSSESPTAFAQMGSTLFVDPLYNGDVEACSLSGSGVSSCITAAVLTSTSGLSDGIAVL